MLQIDKLKTGDIFSESSHYTLESKVNNNKFRLKHHQTGEHVVLDKYYILKLLQSADQFNETIKVTKEDKKDGTLGIRSIWENIHTKQVFTVCYKKQNKQLSDKIFIYLRDEQIRNALKAIEKAQNSKKGVLEESKKQLIELQNNPVLPILEGSERVLRGYKIQFHSRDGKYDCVDMDLTTEDKIRPVNINTIQWLIFDNVKYVVE